MRKESTGYAAFDRESGKGLAISYGITNRLSLTEDPDKVDLSQTKAIAEMHTIWFNNTHKNKKEFEIKRVARIVKIQEVAE